MRNQGWVSGAGLLCLMAASAAAAQAQPDNGQKGGTILDVAAEKQSIVATRIENAVSGYNWVAPNSRLGPSLIQDASAWPVAAKPDDWKLAAAEIRAAEQGADSVTARWLRKDGLELSWTVRRRRAKPCSSFSPNSRTPTPRPSRRSRSWGRWSCDWRPTRRTLPSTTSPGTTTESIGSRYRRKASKSAEAGGTLRPRPAGSPSKTAKPTRSSSSAWNGRVTGRFV